MWRTRNMAVLLCVRKCLFSHSVLNISFESTLALSLTRVNTNTHKTSSVTHMKSRDWTHCMSCPPPRLCLATGEAQGEFVQSATRSPPLVPQEGPLLVCQAGRVWALTRRNGTPHQTYSYIRMLRTDHSADYYRYCTRSDDSETLIPSTHVRFCDDNGSFTAIYDSPQACSYGSSDAMASLNAGALPGPLLGVLTLTQHDRTM
jgi:hypothetical protein